MNWQDYFTLVKIRPGRVKTSRVGIIDFSDPGIPVETIRSLYEGGFPYLEPTPEGQQKFYGESLVPSAGKKASQKSKNDQSLVP